MMRDWFNSREVSEVGTALADAFAPRTAPSFPRSDVARSADHRRALQDLLNRADREVRTLRLNFYKKAKFANSFKWRLIENGLAREIADEVTQALVLHLAQHQTASEPIPTLAAPANLQGRARRKQLYVQGQKYIAQGAYKEAADVFSEMVENDPSDADALTNLGAVLNEMGMLTEAEKCLRQAISVKPYYSEAHCSLGIVLRGKGENAESEVYLRRALKLNPKSEDARLNLGFTLVALGRLRDARMRFEKILKASPRHANALFFMGHIARLEGRFEEAEALFKRVLEIDPKMPNAWSGLVGTRKMTSSDGAWLTSAKEIAASGIKAMEEADLRFAIGKYCDDVGDFDQAFHNYKRANELLKTLADNYDRDWRTCFVDDMIRIYTPDSLSKVRGGVSDSNKPIFIVGMPRSGTSLAEQIVASHPAAKGAGELGFFDDSMLNHDSELRQGMLSERSRRARAEVYLRALQAPSGDASRIVDKAPNNCDYLGPIFSVFPNARIIHMRRDPIDTCLSCYFQHFSVALNFTMDLSDLVHYYREHRRLMAHWHAVLPAGSILEVPYAGLVDDPEAWVRRILDFLGLEWDARCLDFQKTQRQVVTASTWQVRQKIYKDSLARWRNYEKFIGPLMELRE